MSVLAVTAISADYGTYDSMMPQTLGASLAISATSSLSKSIPPATGGKLYMTLFPTVRLADNPASRQKGSYTGIGEAAATSTKNFLVAAGFPFR